VESRLNLAAVVVVC